MLNNDYKILTRILTARINKVVPLIISPEQTGFVPGRFIVDNTQLIRLLQAWADDKEKEGMLVAIDFEKVRKRK